MTEFQPQPMGSNTDDCQFRIVSCRLKIKHLNGQRGFLYCITPVIFIFSPFYFVFAFKSWFFSEMADSKWIFWGGTMHNLKITVHCWLEWPFRAAIDTRKKRSLACIARLTTFCPCDILEALDTLWGFFLSAAGEGGLCTCTIHSAHCTVGGWGDESPKLSWALI